jgi:hypothetical protein
MADLAAPTDVTVIDFEALFDTYIAGKQKVWKHDRSTTSGASEVFNCFRQQVFEKRSAEFGVEPDDDHDNDWGAMERGNILEDHFVVPALGSTLPALGLDLLFAGQSNQETLVLGRNSATPDGLITGIKPGKLIIKSKDKSVEIDVQEGCVGLEIKSIDPRANLVEERSKHHYQSQMGLGLIRELTEWKPRYWIILYVDASFISKLTPFVVEFDESIFKVGRQRAAQIWEFESPQAAPPEGKFDGGCDHCRWRKACGDATISAWKALDDKGEDEYTAAAVHQHVMTYLAAKKDSETAAREFEEAKQALKDALSAQGAKRVVSEMFRINWTTSPGKKYLDQKALQASGVDLKPFMKTGAGFDTLKVTLRKDE